MTVDTLVPAKVWAFVLIGLGVVTNIIGWPSPPIRGCDPA